MITSKDRSGWFGASDTSTIVGNYKTKTFKKWWLVKLGLSENDYSNKAMEVGNIFEHKILDTIPGVRKDHQILISELRLRVNFDGDKDNVIYEVKTTKNEAKISKAYWRQAQVEMYAMKTDKLFIVFYELTERDYKNYFSEIETGRIKFLPVEYDLNFIENEYLPRLKYLNKCLKDGVMPGSEHVY